MKSGDACHLQRHPWHPLLVWPVVGNLSDMSVDVGRLLAMSALVIEWL